MKVAYWTNSVSPHQLPLAKAIAARIGEGNYRYVYRDELSKERLVQGWSTACPKWCIRGTENSQELMDADIVYTGGLRPLNLIERRIAAGKMTYYVTERWFKPFSVAGLSVKGTLRMCVPSFRRMAKRMVALLNNPLCKVLAIGPWARKDMLWLGVNDCQIRDWGYFVEESKLVVGGQSLVASDKKRDVVEKLPTTHYPLPTLRVLWVGRMIVLKHVDTIIKAVGAAVESGKGRFGISLTLAGNGPEKKRLERMSEGLPVKFMDFLPIAKVRELMRANDVFVLASDEHEGWGAVVNEALEEGMKVFGTYEAGASAAMLREDDLFHAGDWRRLADLLARSGLEKRDGVLKGQGIGVWTPSHAAESILGKTWMDGTVNQK